ncbi:hypothetical protein [Novosphingobium sp.]|uniref:hypothetical protein n=1 Tax=Novosphingobium sp. TaxID=1874826 RepID=UPI003D09EB56
MPVTDRPVQPSPLPGRPVNLDKAAQRSTNRLIAIAGAAMVATSVIFFLVNGVN